MYRIINFFRLLLLISFTASISVIFPAFADEAEAKFESIEWPQLMPAEDLDALMNPPDIISQIADGSEADSISSFGQQEMEDETAKRFQEALSSTKVVESFKNRAIKIPGYIVPLETDEEQKVTEFFIVPYFGACLHMPPPPPNQIIFANYGEGVVLSNLYDPFWFEGTLQIELNENAMGTSAYRLKLANVEPYEG